MATATPQATKNQLKGIQEQHKLLATQFTALSAQLSKLSPGEPEFTALAGHAQDLKAQLEKLEAEIGQLETALKSDEQLAAERQAAADAEHEKLMAQAQVDLERVKGLADRINATSDELVSLIDEWCTQTQDERERLSKSGLLTLRDANRQPTGIARSLPYIWQAEGVAGLRRREESGIRDTI
jgi:chromosome segregation ATPase